MYIGDYETVGASVSKSKDKSSKKPKKTEKQK